MSAATNNVDKARYEGLDFKDQVQEGMVPVVNAEAIPDSQISTERQEEELHLERDRRLQAEEKQKQVERELQALRDTKDKQSQDAASSSGGGPSHKVLLIAGMAVMLLLVIAAIVITFMVTRGSSNEETPKSISTNLRSPPPMAISPVAAPPTPAPVPANPPPMPRPTPVPVNPPPMPRPTPRPVFQPTPNQNLEQNLASRSTISIGYLGDALGCTLSLGITIGGTTWVPFGNPFVATQVPSGVQDYSVSGQILCPLFGRCFVTGSAGTVTIFDQELYLVTWVNSDVGVCTVSLVLNE